MNHIKVLHNSNKSFHLPSSHISGNNVLHKHDVIIKTRKLILEEYQSSYRPYFILICLSMHCFGNISMTFCHTCKFRWLSPQSEHSSVLLVQRKALIRPQIVTPQHVTDSPYSPYCCNFITLRISCKWNGKLLGLCIYEGVFLYYTNACMSYHILLRWPSGKSLGPQVLFIYLCSLLSKLLYLTWFLSLSI